MRSSFLAPALGLLASVVYALPNSVNKAVHYTRSTDLQRSYDYIVAGGGTSGLTVADRLTEDGKCT
jgi:choline dehydrogenase